MKKILLAMLALCAASLAQAGWFDSYNDEVPPGLKVERAAGGTDQWNGTMFFTQSTVSKEGKVIVQRDDGIYFDGRKIVGQNKKLGWLHTQIATLCQKDNTIFYGHGDSIYVVNAVGTTEPKLLYSFPAPEKDPEFGQMRSGMSIVTITNDCTKVAASVVYVPEAATKRSDKLLSTLDVYDKQGHSITVVGTLSGGQWSFKEVLSTKGWYSHSQIEPVKGEKIIIFKNGDKNIARNKGMVMNVDGSDMKMIIPSWDTSGTGRVGLCSWVGDGHTAFCRAEVQYVAYYTFIDTDTMKVLGKFTPPMARDKSHEAAVRRMKNGNILFVGDSYQDSVFYGEFDLAKGEIVRWAKIASHGKRYPENNRLLSNEEGWYPHPNMSQDGKFVAFASQNGVGEKGSDVFVVSGLPE